MPSFSDGAAANASDSAVNSGAALHDQKICLSIVVDDGSLVTPEAPEGVRARMARLRAAAHRIGDLLELDLDGAADESRQIEAERLVGAVREILRDRTDMANISIALDCAGGRVCGAEADPRETLSNLVSNAVEATPPRGAVVVQTAVDRHGSQIWCIRDLGAWHPDVLAQVGIPHRTFRRGGSGLGVALAKAIVARRGGMLRFDSVRGYGTTVSICLPSGDRPRAPAEDDSSTR